MASALQKAENYGRSHRKRPARPTEYGNYRSNVTVIAANTRRRKLCDGCDVFARHVRLKCGIFSARLFPRFLCVPCSRIPVFIFDRVTNTGSALCRAIRGARIGAGRVGFLRMLHAVEVAARHKTPAPFIAPHNRRMWHARRASYVKRGL